jgi:hypothetical protein
MYYIESVYLSYQDITKVITKEKKGLLGLLTTSSQYICHIKYQVITNTSYIKSLYQGFLRILFFAWARSLR